MRKAFLVLLGILSIGTMAQAQKQIADLMSKSKSPKVWPLPYPPKGTKNKDQSVVETGRLTPVQYELWDGKLNIDLWKNFWLTDPWENSCTIDHSSNGGVFLSRKFEPLEGDYYIGLLSTHCNGNIKEILVTIDKDGDLIDQLEVEYQSNFTSKTISKTVIAKEFELYDRDSVEGVLSGAHYRFCIKTAHLKPEENLYFHYYIEKEYKEDFDSIPARLYFDYYCIDPTGHFILWQKQELALPEGEHYTIDDYEKGTPYSRPPKESSDNFGTRGEIVVKHEKIM